MMPILLLLLAIVSLVLPIPSFAQAGAAIELLDHQGEAVTALTDGDTVSLRLRMDSPPAGAVQVQFFLSAAGEAVAQCTIPKGEIECTTAPFQAYGWYWQPAGQGASLPQPERQVTASLDGGAALAESLTLTIHPRPVILVHGFLSDFSAWSNYLGEQGFLSQAGIPGFAVGDGQVTGVMKTGNLATPSEPTNTIAQNAAILAGYIQQVKEKTGAQQVDLVGHSMGGLISRYYIDRLMTTRDIAQLVLLGTPSAGSDCAILPAALGFYYPTVLEIRSSYMTRVFNQQIQQRKGVPFFALAGTQINAPVGSACTEIPNDMVVSVGSVTSIDLTHTETPILHVDMNTSEIIFRDYVLPLLQRSAGDTWQEPDRKPLPQPEESLQFSRVFSGHVNPGERLEQFIELEPGLAVANFALYDPSQSLAVTVIGASGKEIVLSPDTHGLMVVDDPATLVTMGYGFANPKPGPWVIQLAATERTPSDGADFALTANLIGGATLNASAAPLLPRTGETVQVSASLELNGKPLAVEQAFGIIHLEDGTTEQLSVTINGNRLEGEWQPSQPGIHAIDLLVAAIHPDGTGAAVERTAYLTVQVQPGPEAGWGELASLRTFLIGGLSLLALFILVGLLFAAYRWISRSPHKRKDNHA